MNIKLKRAYQAPESSDGRRYLVERLWPRGVRKEEACLDGWLKDLAPSDALRRWFGHDPGRWDEFQRRYRAELSAPDKQALLRKLAGEARRSTVTLVFAARDEQHNNAVALKELLENANLHAARA